MFRKLAYAAMHPVPRVFVLLLLRATNAGAAGLTSTELLNENDEIVDRQALARGEIVSVGLSDRESKRQLAAAMLVQLPAPMIDVVHAMQRDPALQMGLSLPVEKPGDWQAVEAVIKSRLTDHERELITDDDAYDHYNLNAAELAQLRKAAGSLDTEAAAWRSMLQNRAKLYRDKGTTALPPYLLADRTEIYPGRQLDEATASMELLQRYYPAFTTSIARYPVVAPGLEQQWVFSVDVEDDRPLFALKHRIVQLEPDHALIAERQYYINHSLDALQVIILCLPTDKGTLVVMLNQTYTGRVAGFGQAIAHRVGRGEMQKKIRPLFVGLQKRFPARASAP